MTYIIEVAIIDQLHNQKYVDVKLALWQLHDLESSLTRAVKLVLDLLVVFQLSGCSRQLQSGVEVFQVELEHKDDVSEAVEFAELFELLG